MKRILKDLRVKKSKELNALGFLIPTAKISQGMSRKRGGVGGLSRCEFDDECDYCNKPRGGSYASITGYEYEEVDFYICRKCAIKTYYKNYLSQLKEWHGLAEYATRNNL